MMDGMMFDAGDHTENQASIVLLVDAGDVEPSGWVVKSPSPSHDT